MREEPLQRPDFLPPGFGTVGHQDFVEIVVPPPVSYTPQTVGWWVLGAALLAALIWRTVWAVRNYRKNAYRRFALAELAGLKGMLQQQRGEALARLPALLKRCALAAFPRRQVASLSGEQWWAFLDRTAPGVFSDEVKQSLYRLVVEGAAAVPSEEDTELVGAVELWIRRHHA